jgi:hypothetical protein
MIDCAGMGQDGRLYFGGTSVGVWVLENDGQISQFDSTTLSYYGMGIGQDGRLYFGTVDYGISVLKLENTGYHLAQTLSLITLDNGVEIERENYNLLQAFETQPTLSQEDFIRVTRNSPTPAKANETIQTRANTFLTYIANLEDIKDYTVNNTVIEEDQVSCPLWDPYH